VAERYGEDRRSRASSGALRQATDLLITATVRRPYARDGSQERLAEAAGVATTLL